MKDRLKRKSVRLKEKIVIKPPLLPPEELH